MTIAMRKTPCRERRKGFALISILLASVMGIGAMSMGVYFYQETSAKKQTNDLSQSFNMIGATISNRMDVINRYRERGGIDPRIILGIDGLPGFTFSADGTMSQPWARGGVSLSWIQEDVVQFSLQGVSKQHCKRIVPQMWGTTYNPSFNAYAMIDGHLISAAATSALDAINRFCHEDVSVGVVVAIDRTAAAEAIGDDAPIVVAGNDPSDGSNPDAGTASGATPSPTTPPTTTPDPTDPGPGVGEDAGGDPSGGGEDETSSDPGTPRDPGGATGTQTGSTDEPTGATDPGESEDVPSGDGGSTTIPDPGSPSQPGTTPDPETGAGDGGDGTPQDPGSAASGDDQTPTDGGDDGAGTGGVSTPQPGSFDNPIPLDLKFPKGKGTAGKTVTSNNLAVLPDGTSVAFQNLKVWGEGDPTLRLSNGKRGSEGQVGSHTNVQIGRGECGATGVFYLQDQSGTIYSYDVASVGCK